MPPSLCSCISLNKGSISAVLDILLLMKGCVLMSTNDYVKYMAKTLIQRMETPRSERKKQRDERKQMKTPFLVNWLGMVPFSLIMWLKKDRRKIWRMIKRARSSDR